MGWQGILQALLIVWAKGDSLCALQILTPAPDNLLAKRLAEKESMTSISVGNGLDTPAGMRYLLAPSMIAVVWSVFFYGQHGRSL